MSKFCGNCGTQLPDDANVCGNCGTNVAQMAAPAAPVAPASAAPAENASTPGENVVSAVKDKAGDFIGKMKSDKKFMTMVIAIAGGAVTLIAVLIVLLCVLGGGYEKAIQNRYDAALGDYDAYIDCYPESYWDEHDMQDEEEFEERLEGLFDDYFDEIDYDFEVVDEDEISGSAYSSLKDRIHERWGVSRKDIGDAYKVAVLMNTEIDDEDNYTLDDLIVVEIDGDWYVFD